MVMRYVLFPLIFCLVVLPFFSCTSRIDGSLSADGAASLSVEMGLKPVITSIIGTFFVLGGQADDVILDGEAIAMSMTGASGINSISFSNTAPAAIQGQIQISNINDFLANADSDSFIIFEQGSLNININLENSPMMMEILSMEIVAYLEAFMAPLVTGEELSKEEYLDIVASLYSRRVSDEIAASVLFVSIEFPGRVTNVRGGTFSGRRADFEIPMLDLLVLEEPLSYEVRWR